MKELDQSKYEFPPAEIDQILAWVKATGKRLDEHEGVNTLEDITIISRGERSGRDLAEIMYADGTQVLFYKSKSGTSGKEQGTWYPIGGFINTAHWNVPKGWFIKDPGVFDSYGSKIFTITRSMLGDLTDKLDTDDLLSSENKGDS